MIIWDPDTDSPVHTLSGHKEKVMEVKWCPASGGCSRLASCDKSGEMKVWDGRTGDCLLTVALPDLYGRVMNYIDFSPNGSLLATSGKTVRIYNTTDWKMNSAIDTTGYWVCWNSGGGQTGREARQENCTGV